MKIYKKTEKNPIKGYKIFLLNEDNTLSCRDFKFKEDKVNFKSGNIETCTNGFHFCTDIKACFRYYNSLKFKNVSGKLLKHIVCEVEGWGEVDYDCCDKYAVSNLMIKKRLTNREVYDKLNFNKTKLTDTMHFHYNLPSSLHGKLIRGYKKPKEMLHGKYLVETEVKEITFKYFNSVGVSIHQLIANRKKTITNIFYKVLPL